MELERKTLALAGLSVKDASQGIAEMYVSVFSNVDYGNEVVDPGFFTESLARRLPKGVWAHDWTAPVAKTLEAEEVMPNDRRLPDPIKDLGGLRVVGKFNLKTQRGREAFSDLEEGIIDEFSIGYEVQTDELKDGVRHLVKGTLYEWSPVLVGMNPMTQLAAVKDGKPGSALPYSQHLAWVLGEMEAIVARSDYVVAEMRAKDDRGLSAVTRSRLISLSERGKEVVADLDAFLAETEPEKDRLAREWTAMAARYGLTV